SSSTRARAAASSSASTSSAEPTAFSPPLSRAPAARSVPAAWRRRAASRWAGRTAARRAGAPGSLPSRATTRKSIFLLLARPAAASGRAVAPTRGLWYIASMLQPSVAPAPVRSHAAGWLERFDEFARAFYASREVPGGAVVVVHRGETVYARAFGQRDREAGLEARTDTVFGLASLSKSFTALTVLALQARGVLDLDDPVTDHLPGFGY